MDGSAPKSTTSKTESHNLACSPPRVKPRMCSEKSIQAPIDKRASSVWIATSTPGTDMYKVVTLLSTPPHRGALWSLHNKDPKSKDMLFWIKAT